MIGCMTATPRLNHGLSEDDPRELPPLEDVLSFLDRAWAGFWVWMDQVGRCALPLPTGAETGLAHSQALHRVCGVAQIEGVSVTDRDGWWLVDRLRAAGRADDVTAAFAIELAIEADDDLDWLTPAEKDAVILALAQHPVTLIKLRTQLARDHLDRAD
jgi:hypothetical protein